MVTERRHCFASARHTPGTGHPLRKLPAQTTSCHPQPLSNPIPIQGLSSHSPGSTTRYPLPACCLCTMQQTTKPAGHTHRTHTRTRTRQQRGPRLSLQLPGSSPLLRNHLALLEQRLGLLPRGRHLVDCLRPLADRVQGHEREQCYQAGCGLALRLQWQCTRESVAGCA
jgi:hypothetical protein